MTKVMPSCKLIVSGLRLRKHLVQLQAVGLGDAIERFLLAYRVQQLAVGAQHGRGLQFLLLHGIQGHQQFLTDGKPKAAAGFAANRSSTGTAKERLIAYSVCPACTVCTMNLRPFTVRTPCALAEY